MKTKMRALSIGCTGMNERCDARRNLDFMDDEQSKPEQVTEILSDSSRAYIVKMESMNEVSSQALNYKQSTLKMKKSRHSIINDSDKIL